MSNASVIGQVTPQGWRLGAEARKTALLVHIASAGTWLGLDVAMGVVVFTAVLSDDLATKAFCYRALGVFVVWPLLAAGLVCLGSGVVLGLGTSYGLLRYWWVAIKLALNVVLTALVLIALRPEVDSLAEQGRDFTAGETVSFTESDIVFPPVVSSAALLIAMTLAVFKPWGRIFKR